MVFEELFASIPYFSGLNQYVRAAIVFFSLFVLLRIILFFAEKIALKIATKTTSDLDDILLKKSSKPLTLISLFISLLIAIGQVTFAESIESAIIKIIYSCIAITAGFLIFVLIDVALVRVWKKFAERTESDIDDNIGQLVHEVMRIVIIVIALLIILNIWGVNIVPMLGALGIAGLAVALALQPTLSNIFSGVSIIIDGTYKVGDIIKLQGGEMGTVFRIGLRTTRIKSFDNEMIIIPNSQIANSTVQNFNQPDLSIRVNVEFGVEYGVDPEYIKRLAIEEVEKIKMINKEEEVRILFTGMGDNSLNFKVMFWVDNIDKKWPAHQEAMTRIYRRLYEEKIGIPFPQRTIWMRDEGKAKSPDPKDKKFKSVQGKYYSSFGHEYKEEEPKKDEEKKKEKSNHLLKRFKFRGFKK